MLLKRLNCACMHECMHAEIADLVHVCTKNETFSFIDPV